MADPPPTYRHHALDMNIDPPDDMPAAPLVPGLEVAQNQLMEAPVIKVYERHPSWTQSRDIVLLFEERTTFRVNFGRLEKYSVTIKEIFDLPTDVTDEGTENNPVRIQGITVKEFDAFLKWFDDLSWRSGSTFTLDELLGVFTVSQQWIIDDGKKWAVEQLNLVQPPLPLSRRLKLARIFHIPEFVDLAVEELMTRTKDGKHIRAFTDDEIEEMGLVAFSIIAKGLEAIDIERALMALTPPTLPRDETCKVHSKCEDSWKKGWSTFVARKLVGKDSIPLSKISDYLPLSSFPAGLNVVCKAKGVAKIKQDYFIKVKRTFIGMVIDKILKAYRLDKLDPILIDD